MNTPQGYIIRQSFEQVTEIRLLCNMRAFTV
jgi:hypothetical protein